eukprot:1217252-Prymnesium_polylepis.1
MCIRDRCRHGRGTAVSKLARSHLACDALTTHEYSAVNGVAAMRSTICQSCIPLAGLRQRGQLV